VIIPEPFYANYNGFAVAAGVTVVPITSQIETGFALPPIAQFEKNHPKTKAILVCNPNNPTGYLYSAAEMEALKTICLKHNLFLFSDEAYREFSYSRRDAMSALHLTGMDEHVVLMDTVSKRYSACGARLGALVTKNKAVYNAALKFAQARLSPPGLAQILGEAAVDLPASYFDEPKEEYKARRDLLVQRLNSMPQVFCPNPGGAFYAMANCRSMMPIVFASGCWSRFRITAKP
jgi:aspartate aminotransferase